MAGRVGTAGAVLVALLIMCLPAVAVAGPIYRDPPKYKGPKKAPQTLPPPLPPAVVLSETGTFPDVLVDEAGTAHIVWNENRGDLDDATTYCRLKRGDTECQTRAELLWTKSYGSGDGPQYNTDNDGPRIVRVGDQLVAFSKRYPTIGEKPDGASSSTVVAWTSNDGGTTWTKDPAIVGRNNLGEMVVLGPGDNPTIVNLGQDPFCKAQGPSNMCVDAYRSGQYSTESGDLATGANQAYSPTLALDGNNPVAAFADLESRIHLRRWNGSGSVADPARWSAPQTVTGDEPSLAGGPSGVHMLSRPAFGAAFEVRSIQTQGDGTVTGGAPRTLPLGKGQFGRLAQDPSGRLIAAWQAREGTAGVNLSTSGAGGGFAAPQTLIDGEMNGQIELDATDDGGGFAVLNHTGSVNSPGQLAAIGFGRTASTERLGLGDLPGGSAAGRTCQEVPFGKFEIESTAGCFLNGTGSNKNVVVTSSEVNLQGLRIVPDAGTKLVIDPKALRIDTIGGDAQVILSNGVTEIVLWHGQVHRDLSKAVPGSNLFEFPAGEFQAEVLGFDIGADIPIKLEQGGVRIPVDLELPKAFGGFTGHAELIAKPGQGLILDSLDIHIGPVPLGVLVINSIDLSYSGAEDTWTGSGSVTVPAGGTLDATVVFRMGDFESASIAFTPASPIPIGPFVYLLRIGGEFGVDPLHIAASARFGAGAAVNGIAPVVVDGKFEMTFPSNGPAHFKLGGSVSVFIFEVGNGFLEFYTDGYAAFGGRVDLDLGPLHVGANMDGFVDGTTGSYGASLAGKVELCVKFGPFKPCAGAGADVAVSNVGFAACAGFDPPDPFGPVSAGIRFPWRDFRPDMLFNPISAAVALVSHIRIPCNTDGYRTPPPRSLRKAQSGGFTVDVAGGLPTQTILVEGEGGPPRVAVTGPGGAAFNSDTPSPAGFVTSVDEVNASYVVLDKPAAGAWTITPLDGSPAIKQVMQSDGYKPASVSASLGGRGASRTISYSVKNLGHDQTVRFVEKGGFGTRVIGTATKSKGTLRFKPADARGAKRTVLALIEQNGMQTDETTVGKFTAPSPPRPGAPGRLKAKRKGTSVTVTWSVPRGAKRQVVRLRGKHTNLARFVSSKTKSLTFTAVRRDEKVTIEVRGLSVNLRAGPTRKVSVGGAR